MRTIPVDLLRPGQKYTEPVYIDGNCLLVPAGIAIRKKDLDQLKAWEIAHVRTNGEVVRQTLEEKTGAGIGALAKKADAQGTAARILTLAAVQENKSVYRAYLDLIDQLDVVFTQIESGLSVENRAIDGIVTRLILTVRESRNDVIGFILGGEVSGKVMAKSSVNVAILSALVASDMGFPLHKVQMIVTGALLHDVGMLKLPHGIMEKQGNLTDAELQRMRAHPLYAFKIVCKELLYPEEVGLIALQHHERWDGEGYPRRVASNAIDMGARIVSVADAFEAMVSQKPYRNSMIGYAAMKNLLSDNSRRFDPGVLKAFIKTMGIYPIGSIVVLNSGAIARVIEVRSEAPLRPRIRILIDDFGKTYEQDAGDAVDLLTEKSLFIARALNPRDFKATA